MRGPLSAQIVTNGVNLHVVLVLHEWDGLRNKCVCVSCGERDTIAVPNGCGRREGGKGALSEMGFCERRKENCGKKIHDGDTIAVPRVKQMGVVGGRGKGHCPKWVFLKDAWICERKKITYIKRSGFLIKSLLQLFKQDINCFGLDLLPAFVDVHGFFEVRHGFWYGSSRIIECEKLKGWVACLCQVTR